MFSKLENLYLVIIDYLGKYAVKIKKKKADKPPKKKNFLRKDR